jgi:hypothetical protein
MSAEDQTRLRAMFNAKMVTYERIASDLDAALAALAWFARQPDKQSNPIGHYEWLGEGRKHAAIVRQAKEAAEVDHA